MKKLPMLLLIITLASVTTLSGCQNARSLNSISIVVGMGIDKAPEPDQTLVTFQIVNPTALQNPSSEKSQSNDKAYWNISQTGETIFAAAREITNQTGKELYFSHNDVVILSRSLAEEGLQKSIDFFLRNTEIRPKSWMLITNETVEEVFNVETKSDRIPSQNIAKTVKQFRTNSHFKAISIQDFISSLLSKTTSPVVPLITITGKETKKINIKGLAVFKKDKMVGTLNETEARGLLWVTNDVQGGIVPIDTPDGTGKIAVEIISAKSKVTPEINNGNITMHIKILMEGSLTEQTIPQDLTTDTVSLMEQKLTEAIKQEIFASFNKSKELSADIFGFGDIIHKQIPNEWTELKNDWPAAYLSITPALDIEAKIIRTNALATSILPE